MSGLGLRGLDVLRHRCSSSQFLTPAPVSSLCRLIHFDFFEPFRGAVSGSCGFYAFKEFLQSREFLLAPLCVSLTGDLRQYVLPVHLLLTVCFSHLPLSGLKDAVVPPSPESSLCDALLTQAASAEQESFQTGCSR